MSKVLLFLNASPEAKQSLTEKLNDYLAARKDAIGELGCVVSLMETLSPDVFSTAAVNGVSYSHSLDFELGKLKTSGSMFTFIGELMSAHTKLLDLVTCTVLSGYERSFRPALPQKFRYHYLMKRQPAFTQADYMDYYTHHHSGFGLVTRGIEAYSQFYVDFDTTRLLADILQIEYQEYSSVSQMDFSDNGLDFETGNFALVGPVATDDEEQFVDRQSSVMMSSTVTGRY